MAGNGNGGKPADKPSPEVDKQATKEHYEREARKLEQEQAEEE